MSWNKKEYAKEEVLTYKFLDLNYCVRILGG